MRMHRPFPKGRDCEKDAPAISQVQRLREGDSSCRMQQSLLTHHHHPQDHRRRNSASHPPTPSFISYHSLRGLSTSQVHTSPFEILRRVSKIQRHFSGKSKSSLLSLVMSLRHHRQPTRRCARPVKAHRGLRLDARAQVRGGLCQRPHGRPIHRQGAQSLRIRRVSALKNYRFSASIDSRNQWVDRAVRSWTAFDTSIIRQAARPSRLPNAKGRGTQGRGL